jgi:uncharacterized protein (TIGR02246 family)
MLRKILGITAMTFCLAITSFAQDKAVQKSQDEAAIRAVVQSLADAWTAGDGGKFGAPFVTDADYTVWNGIYLSGREAIAQGHQQIFDTFYKDTKLQFDIRKIRFLGDTVAIVHTFGRMVKKSEEFPKEPQVVPVFVMSRENGKWQIIAFQNTTIQKPLAAAK